MASDNTIETNYEIKRPRSRRKWYLLALAAVFIVAAGAYGAYYVTVAQFYATTDDAYVQGNRIQLTPQVGGIVTAVRVNNTDFVHAGETIVRLNPSDDRITLDHAKANLARAVRSVRQLYAQVDQQQSIIKQRQSALAQAKQDYERNKHLLDAHGVSRRTYEHSRTAWRKASAALAAARDKLTELKALTDGTTLPDQPRVKQAEAALRKAYLNLQRTRVIAPVTGYIAQRHVHIGEHVDPTTPMLSIVPLKQIWVNANFKETGLASIRIGQPVTLVSEAYGTAVIYHGHVVGIDAGTGAAFSLLPPQNATGNWIKVIRRIPVRIAFNKKHHRLTQHPLRIGLSMRVTIDQHDTSGAQLAKQSPQKPLHQTTVYQRRLSGAQQLITQIINANDILVASDRSSS